MTSLEEKRTEILNMIQHYNASCDLLGGEKIEIVKDTPVEKDEQKIDIPKRIMRLCAEYAEFESHINPDPKISPVSGLIDICKRHEMFKKWLYGHGFHEDTRIGVYVYKDPYGIIAWINAGLVQFYTSEQEYINRW